MYFRNAKKIKRFFLSRGSPLHHHRRRSYKSFIRRVTTTSSITFNVYTATGASLEEITSSVIKEIRHSIWHVLESFIASLRQFLDCGIVHVNPAVYADVINVGCVVTSGRRFAVMIHHCCMTGRKNLLARFY